MWINNSSIQSKFLNKMLLILFFSMGLWSVIWIRAEYSDFKTKSARLRTEYIAAQKQMLKTQVDQVIKMIKEVLPPVRSNEKRKETALTLIADLRFGPEGYFFGSTYQGDPLFSNGKITMDSGSVWDLTDPDGVKIIQEQIQTAKQPEGGFVAYKWHKLTSPEPVPKISYVRGIDEWGWVIGAGVYLDTIENIISENREQLNAGLKKRLLRSLLLLSGLLCLIYFFSKRISRQIGASVNAFSTFAKQAETRAVPMDPDGFQLHEFKEIAVCINNMLKEREKAQTARKKAEEKQKQLQAQLLQMQKLESIGTLAGGIAHDFNNILFPVVGISELLLADLAPGSPEYENVQKILKAGKRGRDIVNQILAFSRRTEQEMKPVRVQQILKEALKLARSAISSDISITLDIQADCGPVLANPTQIHQIAMNLITNAGHAVESNSGSINMTLKQVQVTDHALPGSDLPPGQYILLSVHDTGCGMSPKIMDKIFDPYFTTKQQGKGSGGLGLSVVHGIVRAHKGDIVVQSRPGEGTTFDVYLPVIEESMPAEPVGKSAQIPAGNEHVMLVDDDTAILQIESQILERLGYQTTCFADSSEAVAAFQANPDLFDLIITDMAMPHMTGARLAGEIIAIRPDIPIIMCTGFSERINEKTARDIGIKHLLMKPVVMSDLARAVRKTLDSAGST